MARNIITIEDLSNEEIARIFELADEYLSKMADSSAAWRIRGRIKDAAQILGSTLFYEPSTRTKFSFESALIRLGGHVISAADPSTTSAAKGETLADTVRVIQNYADLIVLRHPYEGAARLASQYSAVPVINAGDGGHEHPTQTLCDLYTLTRERRAGGANRESGRADSLAGVNVLICGDLKNGRTVHSLVYALARFGASILPLPAPGLELPEHVARRLQWEYGALPTEVIGKKQITDLPVDVVYGTPHEPHQQTLFSEDVKVGVKLVLQRKDLASRTIDVCYATRLQKERLSTTRKKGKSYPVIDQGFLKEARFENTRVLHPLPRIDELGYDLDDDPRAAYFKQAAYGVPVRMALMAALLDLRPDVLGRDDSTCKYDRIYEKRKGLSCRNPKCISNAESEKRYITKQFWIVNRNQLSILRPEMPLTLRCCYCEFDVVPEAVADDHAGDYYSDLAQWERIKPENLVVFEKVADAEDAGFRPAAHPAMV